MHRPLHRTLRLSEQYFESRQAMAEHIGMPRSTLKDWLDAPLGSKKYRVREKDPTYLSDLLEAVYARGEKVGFEEGQRADPEIPPEEEHTMEGDTLNTVRNVREPIHSVEEVKEFFDVDTDRFFPSKVECGQHEVPMKLKNVSTMEVEGTERLIREEEGVKVPCFRINVTWKRATHRRMTVAFAEGLMEDFDPPSISSPDVPSAGIVRVISIPDLHLGNLIWSKRGELKWSIERGTEQWRRAFSYLLEGAEEDGVTDLVFDVGNDAAHTNGVRGESANGTPYQQVAPAHHTSEAMARMYEWGIKKALSKDLRVHSVVVHGNHDFDPADWMGRCLSMAFGETGGITIHRSPDPWQFLQFGRVLLGFTHGKNYEGNLLSPSDLYALAAEQDEWGDSEYAEVRTGHTHKRHLEGVGGYVEHKGVLIRRSPTLCPPDAYHKRNSYIGALRAAEAHDYDPENGLVRHRPFLPDLLAGEATTLE